MQGAQNYNFSIVLSFKLHFTCYYICTQIFNALDQFSEVFFDGLKSRHFPKFTQFMIEFSNQKFKYLPGSLYY